MKTTDEWFDAYGVSHQNPTNKLIHWICVPLIFFSIIGLLSAIPTGFLTLQMSEGWHPYIHFGTVLIVLGMLFYIKLSASLALGMALISAIILYVIKLMALANLPVGWISFAIFAKVYQFYGVFHVLLKGELPKSVYDYQVKFLKHASRVHIHIYNLVDGYPPFDLNQEHELIDFQIDYEPHPDRLSVLLRFIFGGFYIWLPHGLIWFFRNLVNSFLLVVAFWVVLFTGKYPQGLFDFQIGTLRWLVRVYAYDWNLTHEYPPFSGRS